MIRALMRCIIFSSAVIIVTCAAIAQNGNCRDVQVLGRMARARSVPALRSAHSGPSEGYRSHLVFAGRQFELSPNDHLAADELLSLIPTNSEDEFAIASLSGFLCDGESMADVRGLSALGDRLARDFARAVLVVPGKMNAYVVYAAEAVQDPHSDYAVQMERVCRERHLSFLTAVETLGDGAPKKGNFATASSDWFRKHIFDPERCRAQAIPEAE